jgi:hypothetical protein
MLKSIFELEPNFNYFLIYTQNWVLNFIYVGNWNQIEIQDFEKKIRIES